MSYIIDAHLEHLRGSKSDRTIEARSEILRRLHEFLPFGVAYATTEQIEAWLAHTGWGRWTKFTYTNHITAFYRWADGLHLDGDPTATIERPKAPRCIPRPATEEQLQIALTSPDPWFVGIVLAAFAGLRVDEIAHAHAEHITEQRLYIPSGKGGDPGMVPTHPFVWSVVAGRSGLLFTGRRGQEVSGRWISANARRHFDALGLSISMHAFRHRYGTMIQQMYGDTRVTQECMRHRSISSTEGYTLVANHRMVEAISSLPVPKVGPASL